MKKKKRRKHSSKDKKSDGLMSSLNFSNQKHNKDISMTDLPVIDDFSDHLSSEIDNFIDKGGREHRPSAFMKKLTL